VARLNINFHLPKLAAFMMTVKDIYAQAGEVFNLKCTDLDLDTNTVNITPEKGSKPRQTQSPNLPGSSS
jgi:hypothetical protein